MATYVSAEFTYQNIVMNSTVVSGTGSTATTLYVCPSNTFARVFPYAVKVNSNSGGTVSYDFYLTSGGDTLKQVNVVTGIAAVTINEAGGFNLPTWTGTEAGVAFDNTLYNQGIPLFSGMTFSGLQTNVSTTFNLTVFFGIFEIGKSA